MSEYCIGIDSFDTPLAGCTTHAASLLIIEATKRGIKLTDYPVLVRLNPTIPWKTRGNGAVALRLKTTNVDDVIKAIDYVLKEYAYGSTKASVIVIDCRKLYEPCIHKLYRKALTSLVLFNEAKECLDKLPLVYTLGETRRGVIGALASLKALESLQDYTYELITYYHPDEWGHERVVDEASVISFDLAYKPYTFLNYDYKNKRILITPHGNDPVLYGVRGEDAGIVARALKIIKTNNRITHWQIFKTNQATNEHLVRKNIKALRPYDNALVNAVIEDITILPGSHTLLKISDEAKDAWAIAFRETGGLRRALQVLKIGSQVVIGGAVKKHNNKLTINIELVMIKIDNTLLEAYTKLAYYADHVKRGQWLILLPDPSAFHHLMMPWERYIIRGFH
ncbi:MAG: DUF1743 domain-containing protein [Pyrodictiaceae archaeon]